MDGLEKLLLLLLDGRSALFHLVHFVVGLFCFFLSGIYSVGSYTHIFI